MNSFRNKIAVIGLDYVGLPLAVECDKKFPTIGFDINRARIQELEEDKDSTHEVEPEELKQAAGTKWNFLPFRSGIVGGHCIGVDPYYLTHKAKEVGYYPEMILAGRRINDNMGSYVADQVVKLMTRKHIHVVDSNILIMGFTFKGNCPDFRNTRVVDLIEGFKGFNFNVDIYDPWVDNKEVQNEHGITPIDWPKKGHYDAVVIAVAHNEFKDMGASQLKKLGRDNHILYDIKYILAANEVDGRL